MEPVKNICQCKTRPAKTSDLHHKRMNLTLWRHKSARTETAVFTGVSFFLQKLSLINWRKCDGDQVAGGLGLIFLS
jgi:hypothetical protein